MAGMLGRGGHAGSGRVAGVGSRYCRSSLCTHGADGAMKVALSAVEACVVAREA